jgi:hypothetical protein
MPSRRDGDNPRRDIVALILAKQDSMKAELEGLTVKDLRQRAATAGVAGDRIEEARDGNDPKHDLIALVLGRQARP